MTFGADEGKACARKRSRQILLFMDILGVVFVKAVERSVFSFDEERDVHLYPIFCKGIEGEIGHVLTVVRRDIICNFMVQFV